MGEKLTWIVPYKFSQNIPQFVDVGVMLNFLEFYETLLGFVNFKLFHSLGLHYPPEIDIEKEDQGEGLFSLILNPLSKNQAEKTLQSIKKSTGEAKELPGNYVASKRTTEDNENIDDDEEEEENEENNNTEEAEVFQSEIFQENKELNEFQNLFSNCCFFLSREVPKESLEFVIRCFGGKVSWDGELAPYSSDDACITHYIIDRDIQPTSKYTRAFVQPQYVYDCINSGLLLPVEEYGINCKLPAHLSPFVNDESEGYVPQRSKELKKLIANAKGEEYLDSDDDNSDINESDDEIQEELYQKELEAEQKGISFSDAQPEIVSSLKKKDKKPSKRQRALEEEEQQNQFRKTMIPSRRRRRLYDTIKYTERRKQQQNQVLAQKARLLEKARNHQKQ